MDGFQALLFQVVGQQLSVGATRRILTRLMECFGGELPTPAQLLDADPARLRRAGLSQRKVATVRALAAQFADGALSDRELALLSDAEIEARLTTITGIGPWTVHGFLIIALDRPDVVLPGDLALRKAIQTGYGLDHLPSEAEVIDIAEPWRPYRSLATAYLFQSAFDRGAVGSAGAPAADSADGPPGGAGPGERSAAAIGGVAWSQGNWEDAGAGGPLPRAEGGQRWQQS